MHVAVIAFQLDKKNGFSECQGTALFFKYKVS